MFWKSKLTATYVPWLASMTRQHNFTPQLIPSECTCVRLAAMPLPDEPFKPPTLLLSVCEKPLPRKLDFSLPSCWLPATAGLISRVYDWYRTLDARNVILSSCPSRSRFSSLTGWAVRWFLSISENFRELRVPRKLWAASKVWQAARDFLFNPWRQWQTLRRH